MAKNFKYKVLENCSFERNEDVLHIKVESELPYIIYGLRIAISIPIGEESYKGGYVCEKAHFVEMNDTEKCLPFYRAVFFGLEEGGNHTQELILPVNDLNLKESDCRVGKKTITCGFQEKIDGQPFQVQMIDVIICRLEK